MISTLLTLYAYFKNNCADTNNLEQLVVELWISKLTLNIMNLEPSPTQPMVLEVSEPNKKRKPKSRNRWLRTNRQAMSRKRKYFTCHQSGHIVDECPKLIEDIHSTMVSELAKSSVPLENNFISLKY